MSRRSPALVSSASVLLAASVLLTGCGVPDPAPSTSADASGTPAPSGSATPTASPGDATSTPVDVPCDTLVTGQAMYDYNPNFSLLPSWTPDAGTPAAEAADAEGVVCRWRNDTSGETIDISVASLNGAALDEKANETFSQSTMVPTYGGDEGYFAVGGGGGEAVVFDGSYWIVVSSTLFYEPGDAEPIVAAVLSALP
ncbi:DUF3558 domain-containing protein [Protaetiibacter mangrovi]|uniref:DUF3558 domain-containing protein n=1 Tax=Protaetiibacter mangrovi TaxID=2970926 RepID=A0ABT1ZIZ2_9MICO|nr:DUF3558 domain-containing protein [Protaetiibacter mangrovi]MCS0500679.1 DUF3558 domain-containing protein [Protaetiibacter mangrovi]TPX05061.1 arginyl-tRNA synthetase [Schumannella luteola]